MAPWHQWSLIAGVLFFQFFPPGPPVHTMNGFGGGEGAGELDDILAGQALIQRCSSPRPPRWSSPEDGADEGLGDPLDKLKIWGGELRSGKTAWLAWRDGSTGY